MDRRKFKLIILLLFILNFFNSCILYNSLNVKELLIDNNNLEIYLEGKPNPGTIKYVEYYEERNYINFKSPSVAFFYDGYTYEKNYKQKMSVMKIPFPSSTLKYGINSVLISCSDGYIEIQFIIWSDKHKENDIIEDEDLKNCRIGLIKSTCSFCN